LHWLTVIHAAAPADVAAPISDGLDSIVHSPTVRRRVFDALAADPRTRLTLAVADGVIVGRVSLGPSFGRWSAVEGVRELAVEVARDRRRDGLGTALLEAALADPAVEDEILLAFALPDAWDARAAGLDDAEYGQMLATFLGRFGFHPVDTDEPEVRCRPGAALLVRVGARVPPAARTAFERARYAVRPVAMAA